MTEANHHSKSEPLVSDRPFENRTILNQNIKTFGIGMVFGFPSSVLEPPLYCINYKKLSFKENNLKSVSYKQILDQIDYNQHNILFSVLMCLPGLYESDNMKRMKTLPGITFSGFYCIIVMQQRGCEQVMTSSRKPGTTWVSASLCALWCSSIMQLITTCTCANLSE